jgi:tellurite resistance protein TehA-like permease
MAAERAGRASLCDVVREFTPNWFSVTMGTGALALALNQMPLPVPAIYDLAGGLWLLDILLFVLFTVIYAARWICLFDEARRILGHSVLSMFLGAIPMGLAPSTTDFSSSAGDRTTHVLPNPDNS